MPGNYLQTQQQLLRLKTEAKSEALFPHLRRIPLS